MPSSVIRDHHYEVETEELTITFVTGRVYLYQAVPAEVYGESCSAQSKGTFFNANIRDRYRTKEITPR